MAGDWIKVEKCTPDKPEMAILARKMKCSVGDAFLEWFRFYAWLDTQTSDGVFPDLVPMEAGHLSRSCPDLVPALLSKEVGWLVLDGNGFRVANWDRHNGKNAKTRSVEARKKKLQRSASRSCPDALGTSSGPEKRREENIYNTPIVPLAGDAAAGDGSGLDAQVAEVTLGDPALLKKQPRSKRVARPSVEEVLEKLDWPHPENEKMQEVWPKWVKHRLACAGKCADWLALFDEQAEALAELTSASAVDVVRASLMNGWRGLFTERGEKRMVRREVSP